MASDLDHTTRLPLIRLLATALAGFSEELSQRVEAAGYTDIRPGHGCVFGTIDPEGSRLTDLAHRANMTKQSVVERVPDPDDGRAKIIRLTDRGREAQAIGRRLIDEVEREWAESYGDERVTMLREALEAITAERLGAVPA